MGTILVGTAGFTKRRERYAQKLAFVELELRAPAPGPKTLAAWRREVGPEFAFALVAPATLWGDRESPLRDAKTTDAQLKVLAASAKALGARAIVLRSPPAVRPGSVAFRRFTELVVRVKKLAPLCVWQPHGVWSHEDAREAAKPLGLVAACDPLRDDVEGEPVVYARLRGLGSDRRYHEGRLEDLIDALRATPEAFVVFDTSGAFAEAGHLASMIANGALDEAPEDDDAPIVQGFGADEEEDADEEDADEEDADEEGDEEDADEEGEDEADETDEQEGDDADADDEDDADDDDADEEGDDADDKE